MASETVRPSFLYMLFSFLALLLLTPFLLLYSRRVEKNLAKNHYKPVDASDLCVAKRQFNEIAERARHAGLTFCGHYAQAPGTGTGREELQLWLNDRRDSLVVILAHRVWWFPVLLERRVVSHLGDGRRVTTVGAMAMLEDVSGLEDVRLFPDVTLGELLVKHEWRLAELDEQPLPFDATNAIAEYEQLEWLRVQALAELGYVTIVDPQTTQWRYTREGEAALKEHNRVTPEEIQAAMERDRAA